MFRTMNLLMALSLGTSTPDDSHLTRLTCTSVQHQVTFICQTPSIAPKRNYAYVTSAMLGTPVVSSLLGHPAVP